LPNSALLARLGGDEFGVIAPTSQAEATELALALRATLSYPLPLANSSQKIDVSIGYSPITPNQNVAQLLHQADLAMYEAKRSGQGTLMWRG
jgi:diguanylate cyclase (GGDEF)-like protein